MSLWAQRLKGYLYLVFGVWRIQYICYESGIFVTFCFQLWNHLLDHIRMIRNSNCFYRSFFFLLCINALAAETPEAFFCRILLIILWYMCIYSMRSDYWDKIHSRNSQFTDSKFLPCKKFKAKKLKFSIKAEIIKANIFSCCRFSFVHLS